MSQFYPAIFRRAKAFLFVAIFLLLPAALLFAQTPVVINTTGSWTVPAGVKEVKVEVWGGGGGGGGVFFGKGGGGGGGSYKTETLDVLPGQVYTVTIGGAGAAGVAGSYIPSYTVPTNGGAGGTTEFTGTGGNVSTSGGGGGGAGFNANGTPGSGGASGTFNGGNGGNSTGNGAGGGGGAGNNGAGGDGTNDAVGVGGAGTPSAAPYIGGDGGAPLTSNVDANIGSSPGGGGSGGFDGLGSGASGGAGGAGQVVLTYTVNLTPTITAISATSGCAKTTPIVITGTNFVNGSTSVSFGGTPALSVVFNSTTQITATPDAGNTGFITVTTSGGTATSAGSFTVNPLPVATISYPGTPFCSTSGTATVTQTGTTGGAFSSTAGLSINSMSGDVNLSTSTAGTYVVTYTFTNGTCSNTTTAQIIVTASPSATISYGGSPFCTSSGAVTVTRTGTSGGSYSASPGGLTLNPGIGTITPSSSTPGTYTVTYTIAASGGCAEFTTTTSVIINAIPTATISYGGSPYCSNSGTATATQTGTTGGTYSASSGGLSINSSTGEVNLSASPAGTYLVTYTFTNGTCSNTTTAQIIITATPSATISYSGTPFCISSGGVTVTRAGTAGGTYSASPGGLTISSTTGTITPSSSPAGTYTVTYTIGAAGGCLAFTTTASVTINALPTATISYGGSPYCSNSGTATVTQTGTTGGAFSSTAGLSINSITGDVNLSVSTAGTYTVTYTFTNGTCSNTTTAQIIITAAPTATISYSGTPFCTSSGAVTVTRTGTAGGVYSASPGGLGISSTTGTITPSGSTAGTYTVTYTIAAANGCALYSTTTSVTITALPTATISYGGSPYCSNSGTATVTQTGTSGGTYSSTTGLSINSSTGVVNLSASTAGTYTVSYTIATSGGCATVTVTASITISAAPSAIISYSGTPFCTSSGVVAVTRTGTAGGTYSASPGGLSISSTTGTITPSSSTPGTYTVTYTIAASGGCALYSTTASVTINALPAATISYGGSPYCSNSGTATVTQTGTTGGTYSSTAGLSINSITGVVNLLGSMAGTYTVTYTFTNGTCSNTTTAQIIITAAPTATISYSGTPFCTSSGAVTVTRTGTAGGVYSASPGGLGISSTTGTITPSGSTAGTYTVTYTIGGANGCALYSTTTSVTITALPTATISYGGSPYCSNSGTATVTQTGTTGGTYSSNTGLSINGSTGVVNLSASTAGTYTVSYTIAASGGCATVTVTASITVSAAPSAIISYSGTPFCTSSGVVAVTRTGTAGGTYSTSSGGLSINSTTGTITPSSSTPGTYTVTYTIAASSGCALYSTTASVTINGLPAATTVTGAGTYCGSTTITAANGSDGTMYFQGTTSNGTSTATPATSRTITSSGTYYFRARSASGCWGPQGSAIVTINSIPAVVTVAGAGTFCGSTSITATGGSGGTVYFQGTTSGGTSTALKSPQTITTSGTYYFRSRSTSAGNCWGPEGSVTVTINPLPATTTVTGGGTFCGSTTIAASGGSGGTIYFQGTTFNGTSTATPSTSQTISASGTYYFRSQSALGCWGPQGSVAVTIRSIPGPVTVSGEGTFCGSTSITASGGSGGTVYFQGTTSGGTSTALKSPQTITSSGTYYFRSRSTSTGNCWGPEGSVTVTINPIPGVTTVSGGGTFCGSTAISATGGSGGTIYFQGTTSNGVSTADPSNSQIVSASGTYYFRSLSAEGCWGPQGSVVIVIKPVPTAGVIVTENSGIDPNDNTICAGSTIRFTASGGTNYNFYRVGTTDTLQKGTNNVLNTSTLVDGDQINVRVLNSVECATTFGPIVIAVTPLPTPTLTTTKATICPGEEITFTATGGDKYNFKVGGATVQNGSSSTYTSIIWTNGDIVTVEVTNENNCTATSTPVTVTVNTLAIGSFTSTASPSNAICAGENVTFAATGGEQYQFSVNGNIVQNFSTTTTFSSNTLTNPSVVSVEVKNASGCIATYAPIVITVNTLPEGEITVTEDSGTPNNFKICADAPVTYTFPTGYKNYDFRVNGFSAQSNGSNTYINTTLVADDVVTVLVKSNSGCEKIFTAPGVTIAPSPIGTLTASDNTICAEENVTFTATYDANNTNYNFLINNVPASTGTSNIFITNILEDDDVVTVEVTNNNGCITTFNPVTMSVTALPTGTMTIAETSGLDPNDGTICAGAEVTFTAPPGFTNYNFLLNGSSIQDGTSATYTTTTLNNGNKVTVAVTNAGNCIALLNEFTMTVNPLPTVTAITGAAEVCVDDNITLANATSGGDWSSSDEAIATVDENTGVVTGVSSGDVDILYTVWNTTTNCSNTAIKSISINALPVVAATTGDLNVCIGSTTTLSNATTGGVWSSDAPGVATIDGSGNVTGVADGTANISYTVANEKGCITVITVVLNVHALPVVEAIKGKLDVCINATETLTNASTGGAWSSSNPLVATVVSSTGVVTGVAQGTAVISYTVTNNNNCETTVKTTIIVNPLPVPSLDGANPICPNSTEIYTTQSGQENYTWTVTGGRIINGGTTDDADIEITWDLPGARTIYVNYTDANGCTGANSATLETSTGTIPDLNGDLTVCLNSDGSYSTNAGFSNYLWTASNGTVTAGTGGNEHTATVNWTASGNQTVTVNFTDGNGCVAAAPTVKTVLVNPLPTATVTTNKVEVCQDATQLPVITFTGANGLRPYKFTYTINGGSEQIATTSSSQNTVSVTVPTGITGTFEYQLVRVESNTTCSQLQSSSVMVIVTPTPSATIAYSATPVCKSSGPISVTQTGTEGGTYTAAAALTIDASTGDITPATSTPGTYTVTYRVAAAGGCAAYTTTTSVTITAAPDATITYNGAPFCTTATPKSVTRTGSAGGTYSSTTGLTISASTGQITPATSTPGTYTVTYTIDASGGCAEFTATAEVTITVAPSATIAYSASPYCIGAGTANVTRTGTAGGTYSATPSGLSIDASTGAINLASSTGDTYTVTYSVVASGGCAAISTQATVVINPAPTAVAGTSAVLTCANTGAVNITAGSSAANYSSVLWTSSGTGTIADGNSLTTATYTPGAADITAGSVTLTLKATGNGGCGFVTSTKALTISAIPPTFLIEPASAIICEGDVQTLSASSGASSSGSMTFTSSVGNNNKSIPNPGSTTSTINMSGLPAGATITSVDVKFNISHSYTGELVLNLKAPNGNVLNLVNRKGGRSGNGFNTTIRSTATNNINGNAPFPGTYRADRILNVGAPQVSNVNTFAQLLGTMSGNWVLSAQDIIECRGSFLGWCYAGSFDGKINNWSIVVNYNVPLNPLSVTWSPVTDLYTDIETTTPYTGQDLSKVYAKPVPGAITYTATQTNASGCNTSKTVNINTRQTPVVSIVADYCIVPGFVRLTASSVPVASSYLWSNGATTSTIQVDESGIYEVQAFVSGSSCPGDAFIGVSTELVINGDFESGAIEFNTDYRNRTGVFYNGNNATGLYPEGDYAVDKSAFSPRNGTGYHKGFHGRDHTTGTGNFMMVNGSKDLITIWEQTVNVLPNTDYYFSAWAMNLNPGSPARLRFTVNGVQVGTIAELSTAPKPETEAQVGLSNWIRFYSNPTWKSGPTTTTAVIRIINLNTAPGGNDFGLDDISFGTLSTFINLESAPGTDAQTVCKNTPIEMIRYSVGNGSPTGPTVSGLPDGVTSVFNGDRLTITGTPTLAGDFTYTITTTGCGATTATGTITVEEQKIVFSSGSTAPVCKDASMPTRVYTLSGTATGAAVSGLPDGVDGELSGDGKSFTISGTPIVAGTSTYTITTSGTCEAATITGDITVQEQTITLNSVETSPEHEVCINTGIANIQYTAGGTATGATITGLPAGVTGKYTSGIILISGTPTVAGEFNYTVTTSGNCGVVTATGTIIVTPAATIVLSSAAGTGAQVACNNLPITDITYAVTDATGASITGGALPTGITGGFSGGVFTISGSTAQTGTFTYTITTSGGCASATITGTITVNGQKIVLTSGAASPSVCAGAAMTDIVYTISGEAAGAGISGQPDGVIGTLSGSTFTVSGIPTDEAGPYPYTITTSGPNCTPATLKGTITVQPTAIGGTLASESSTCSGGNGTLTVLGAVGSRTWQVSTDGGDSWTNVSPVNHTISLTYTNLTSGRQYRVEVSNDCGPVHSTVAMVGVHNLWTGATGTDWQTAGNWSDNQLPDMTCPNVYIPNTTNQPVLANGSSTIGNIYIDAGAILTVNGTGSLQIAGTINNSGTFDASEGEIDLNGTVAQNIGVNTFEDNAVKDLKISNATGVNVNSVLDVYGSLEFGSTNATINTNGNLTLKSNIKNTAWVGKMEHGETIDGDVTVERFINTGTGIFKEGISHWKSWNLLAVPTDGAQSINSAWQEGATLSNVASPAPNTGGNPHEGYGTMIVSNKGGVSGAEALGFDQFTAPGPSIKVYNPTTGDYDGPPNTLTTSIYNIKGYLVLVRGDRSVFTYDADATPTTLRSKGRLFTPADPPPTSSASPGLFESVGNPYASAIDLRNVSVSGGLAESFIVWDPRAQGAYSLGAFTTLTKGSGGNFYATPGSTSYPGTNIPYNMIESGQAFFIQAVGSVGTIKFTENAKASGSNPQLLRGQGGPGRQSQLRTNMYVGSGVNTTLADGTLIQYDVAYSNDLDILDARKLTNTSENLGLNSNSKTLAVERRAPIVETDTVFFKISGMRVQPYKFEFIATDLTEFGVEGIIEDNYLQTKTPLNMEGKTEYSFTIENKPGSYAADRFRIVFKAAAGPLPVTFVSLKAAQQKDDIMVDWKVENETNMKEYEVEKSLDGNRFIKSATITALNNGAGSYNWLDKDVTPGWNYYRVKSIDQNGKLSYSEVVKVMIEMEAPLITVYPNPIVNGVINVHLVNQPAGTYKLRLLNALGQSMVTKQVTREKGTSIEPLTWDYKLARGNYRIEITKPDGGVKLITVIY